MDPRLGIDTSGPGEAVFAIRFNGKPQFELKFQNPKKIRKNQKKYIRTLFWDELEMSSGYNKKTAERLAQELEVGEAVFAIRFNGKPQI